MALDKRQKIDQIMQHLAQKESTGFLSEQRLMQDSKVPDIGLLDALPVVELFDPVHYLASFTDYWQDEQKESQNQSFTINSTSPCHIVQYTIMYLAVCAKSQEQVWVDRGWQEEGEEIMYQFISKQSTDSSEFSILFVSMALDQYKHHKGHYFTVIRLDDKFKLIQSFGGKYSMQEQLERSDWIDAGQMQKIIDAFLFVLSAGNRNKNINNSDIKNNCMLSIGIELEYDDDHKQQKELPYLMVIDMHHISFDEFQKCGKHLIDYFKFMFKKFDGEHIGILDMHQFFVDIPEVFTEPYLKLSKC